VKIFSKNTIIALTYLIAIASLPLSAKTDNELVNWNYIDFKVPLKTIHKNLFLRETISPRLKNLIT